MRDLLLSIGADRWVLPVLVAWPLFAAVVVAAIGRDVGRHAVDDAPPVDGVDARLLTLIALIVEATLGLALGVTYDAAAAGWQARADFPWLADIGATLSMGVDGLSLPLLIVTVVLLPLSLVASWNNVRTRSPAFGALALVLSAGLVGVFVSLDLLMFYLSWELMLIPTYFLVGIWGSRGAPRAALRYVLFTLVGSLLMLLALLALWNAGDGVSFHLDHLLQVRLSLPAQLWMFGAFFLAFAVKSALVPFHTWLPDAQEAAPTFIAVTLGLKVGVYGMLRFAVPLFPGAAMHPSVRTTVCIVSVITILYGALLAFAQRDPKRLVTYSSISHLGFAMLGVFVLTPQSIQGAVMLMINQAVTTSLLFLLLGMLYDRRGRGSMTDVKGLAHTMPLFSVVFTLAILSSLGLPGTSGFVGEFLVLLGAYSQAPVLTVLATGGVVLAAVYGLHALRRLVFDAPEPAVGTPPRDLSRAELAVASVFVVTIVWLGLSPAPVLRRAEPMAQRIVDAAERSVNAATVQTPSRQQAR